MNTLRNVFGFLFVIPVIVAVIVGLGLVGYVIIEAISSGNIIGSGLLLLFVSFFIGGFGLMLTLGD